FDREELSAALAIRAAFSLELPSSRSSSLSSLSLPLVPGSRSLLPFGAMSPACAHTAQGAPAARDQRPSALTGSVTLAYCQGMDTDATMQELHELECWERLASKEFGRLAYHLLDEVHIVPINYAVDGKRLIFRTTEGSKLLGVVMHSDVAFE